MSKRCARCEKTVYPLEELKCLDKIWHKGCFKCQECGMTLSMKTYKGFNKLPYCEAHIPKAKATTVAETPEMRRLAENTKIQSNVQYHADFEKNKAKFTQVADDPETQRLKKNTKIISNVAYHGELERKAEMERKRSEPGEEDEGASLPGLSRRPCDMVHTHKHVHARTLTIPQALALEAHGRKYFHVYAH
nr:LIM and SH3 domain protein Lasp-like [Penaeus vannamei]